MGSAGARGACPKTMIRGDSTSYIFALWCWEFRHLDCPGSHLFIRIYPQKFVI